MKITVFLLCNLFYSCPVPAAEDAEVLLQKYLKLTPQLRSNQFQRPLSLDSAESSSAIRGDLYSVLDYSFESVNRTLNDQERGPDNGCDVFMLHIYTKDCYAISDRKGKRLILDLSKEAGHLLKDTYRLEFHYLVEASTSIYFRINLKADSGPLGTRDYRIALEAVAIDSKRTFLHLTYSYRYGMLFEKSMKLYLSTIGRDKVGFTIISNDLNAQPVYITGLRGVMERNIMRYYLAILAYLSALSEPPDQQLETRLSNWFNSTEQYRRQLHEVERNEYMQMKYQQYRHRQGIH